MRISKRLQRVAGQVRNGGVVADIGCDHGFTSIYLIENHLADRVFAMDINPGPLMRAREHICQYGMEDKITVMLSDGAKELSPGEADGLLISGMGGALICKILRDSREVTERAGELVLSPQSEPYLVRHLVQEMGFAIDREEMLCEQGKYYVIIHAVPGRQCFDREEEYMYGSYLIHQKDGVLLQFLEKEQKRVQGILRGFEKRELPADTLCQKRELEEILAGVQWIMGRISDY